MRRFTLIWGLALVLILGGLLPACRSAPDPLAPYRSALILSAEDDRHRCAD